ncbi:MAG: RuBisCO large subunit C-terminal-like domain-containing protein [Nitrospiraceae bacterium]
MSAPTPLSSSTDLGLSGQRLTVTYLVQASGADAERMAHLLCIDQTVESTEEVIPAGPIRDELLGHVRSIMQVTQTSSLIAVDFPVELIGTRADGLLHLLFGTSSLKPGIRVIDLAVPKGWSLPWPGPRFGRAGFRQWTGVSDRPILCAVLKPLGRSPKELAALAMEFALGGIDCIKDDQGLADHPFCRFADRVAACAEAVAEANRRTGGSCRYIPHVGGSADDIRTQAAAAKALGAGGLLVCPGLSGYDSLRDLSSDRQQTLPIVSHPSFLGTYTMSQTQGIAPSVLYGILPRLLGADVSIYPTYGPTFGVTRYDCAQIAEATANPAIPLPAIFPTAAGRMGREQLEEIVGLYGKDVVVILGSRIQSDPDGIQTACRRVREHLAGLDYR